MCQKIDLNEEFRQWLSSRLSEVLGDDVENCNMNIRRSTVYDKQRAQIKQKNHSLKYIVRLPYTTCN